MPNTSSEAWKPYERGYHAVYREHDVNHCPGCGRTHWIIGRISAECAFCTTAMPLAEASMRSHNGPVIIQHKNRDMTRPGLLSQVFVFSSSHTRSS